MYLSRGVTLLVLVLFLSGFATVLITDLVASRQREYETVRRDSDNLSQVIERQIMTAVEKIDIVLQQVAFDFAPVVEGKVARKRLDVNKSLQHWMAYTPEVQAESLRIIDKDGHVIFNAGFGDTLPDVNVYDRAYFQQQKNSKANQLVISAPLLSRFTGKWLITLSRPILDGRGEFNGVVQMALRAEYFQSLFEQIDIGELGNVSLFDTEWHLLSRHPALPEQLGHQFKTPAVEILVNGETRASYESISRVDGMRRLFVVRRLQGLPYTLVIGRSPEEFLYGWRIKAILYGLAFVALSLALCGLLLFYHRYTEHNRRLITQAFEASGEAIVVTDADGLLINANQAFSTITGYTVNEVLGRSVVDLLRSERHDDAFYTEMARQLVADGQWRGEIWHRHRNGDSFPHLLVISALHDKHGNITNCVGLFSDISALHSARLQAEAASRAKGAFLATMSHEIRTPLNGILGMSQLLLMPNLKQMEVQEFARTILNSGNTLLTLLNGILDLSKIEAGKLEIRNAPFSPRQLLDELYALFRDSAVDTGLALSVTWHGEAQSYYAADATRLRQILWNLINNAIKFTPQGWVRVDGYDRGESGDSSLLEFVVSDSGIGIPADKQAELFKPFSQVDDSNTRQFGGTGLGLSIVRSLAELMGGTASCTSEAGKGSIFHVTLRAEKLMDCDLRDDASRLPVLSGMPDVTPPEVHHVLLIEDNIVNRKVVSAMLERLGCRVKNAENGRDALTLIRNGAAPDLIVMDCQMPVMDGFEATRLIRAWESEQALPRTPIIALTAAAFESDRTRCFEAGMDDYLTKPVNVQRLRDALKKHLADMA
ncbi:MAG TPA: ATP-binding protein [Rhodocyclaceae bacterium]|nr:ATP-binding protein [Rhodocyclaceae bacterium]